MSGSAWSPRARRLASTLALVVLAWLFWDWLWPVRMLVVFFHELGHLVMALATGGSVLELNLSPMEGGHVLSRGGNRFLTLNAGYLGSLVAGVVLLALGRKGSRCGAVLSGLGALLAVVTAVWVPWFGFAFFFNAIMAGLLLFAGPRTGDDIAQVAVRFLGLVSVAYALFDIQSDVLWRFGDPSVRSDAVMLAELTGVPSLVWGLVWLLISFAVLMLTRRWWL